MLKPFNIQKWLEDNEDLLKPPVCNKIVYSDEDFILMAVGGPNQRKDFHYNEGAEIFYQVKGDMILKIRQNAVVKDILIKEGEIFQLPPKIPHSPQRFSNTLGIVLERKRMPAEKDALMWYCDDCDKILYKEDFYFQNAETDLLPVINRFFNNLDNRTCNTCYSELKFS